jgi:hypothetical protein
MLKGKVAVMEPLDYNGLIKAKKYNIGTEEAPKMASI